MNELLYKLNSQTWDKMPRKNMLFIKGKEKLIKDILNYEKKNYCGDITIEYQGNKWNIHIEDFGKKLKVYFVPLGEYLGGFHDYKHDQILLNEIFCNHDEEQTVFDNEEQNEGGREAYKYLIHELHHSFQHYLIQNREKLLLQVHNDSNFGKYLDQIESYMYSMQKDIKCMNFSGIGNLHINPYEQTLEFPSEQIDGLSKMFYHLNIVEFEAHSIEQKKDDILCEEYGVGALSDYNFVYQSKYYFKQRYCYETNDRNLEPVKSLGDDEIVWNISNSILKVSRGEQPDNSLEANIMYDICCIALLQNKSIGEKECVDLLKKEIKGRNLAKYNFSLSGEDSKFNNEIIRPSVKENNFVLARVHPEFFDSLDEEGRRNNPQFVLYVADFRSKQGENCQYLFSESLKQYCKTKREQLLKKPIYKNGAIAIFGEDFWKKAEITQTINSDLHDSLNFYEELLEDNVLDSNVEEQFTYNEDELEETNQQIQ